MGEVDTVPGFTAGQVSCKNTEEEAVTVNYDWGSTLQETIEKFGEDVIHYHVCKKFATSMRNKLYSLLNAGDEPSTPADALTEMNNWVPTVTTGRAKKSLTDIALEAYAKMTPEARATFLSDVENE